MKKKSFMKCKKFVKYAKKYLVLIKTIKMYLNYIIKRGIIVITQKNLGERLIVFAILDTKQQKKLQ